MSENVIYHKPTFDNISQEKREKIMLVSITEFANHGFENANINIIAKQAGVSVGSLYKYFDTKRDLFLTAVNYGVSSLDAILQAIAMTQDDIMVKLEKLIRAAIDFSRKNAILIKLYNEITAQSNTELVAKIANEMERLTATVYKKTIIEGQLAGEIRTDIDPSMAAFLLDSVLMNIQFTYACDYYSLRHKIYSGDDIFEKDEFVVKNILMFIKAALKPQN
ncbi:MAG: TetR/AcrR family transcriptional regulator [Clostridia bacterium]